MNKEENTVSLPTDASIDCIRKMYWEDKKYEQPIVSYNHQTELDVLDRICYGRNQRILMENTMEKQRIFRHLKRLVCSRGNNFVCRKIDYPSILIAVDGLIPKSVISCIQCNLSLPIYRKIFTNQLRYKTLQQRGQ